MKLRMACIMLLWARAPHCTSKADETLPTAILANTSVGTLLPLAATHVSHNLSLSATHAPPPGSHAPKGMLWDVSRSCGVAQPSAQACAAFMHVSRGAMPMMHDASPYSLALPARCECMRPTLWLSSCSMEASMASAPPGSQLRLM